MPDRGIVTMVNCPKIVYLPPSSHVISDDLEWPLKFMSAILKLSKAKIYCTVNTCKLCILHNRRCCGALIQPRDLERPWSINFQNFEYNKTLDAIEQILLPVFSWVSDSLAAWLTAVHNVSFDFLADRTNCRAYATMLRPSVVVCPL